MQIGPLNPLTFLSGSSAPVAGNANDSDTAAAAGNNRAEGVAIATPAQDAASVILALRSDVAATPGAALPADLVYAYRPKAATAPDVDGDTQRMALQHSQAVARSADSATRLSLDKDGVLVAKPASPAEIKAKDFVHFAVGAMRDYADAQDRLKQADAAAATPLIPRSLGDVQKLTARFKLFA